MIYDHQQITSQPAVVFAVFCIVNKESLTNSSLITVTIIVNIIRSNPY